MKWVTTSGLSQLRQGNLAEKTLTPRCCDENANKFLIVIFERHGAVDVASTSLILCGRNWKQQYFCTESRTRLQTSQWPGKHRPTQTSQWPGKHDCRPPNGRGNTDQRRPPNGRGNTDQWPGKHLPGRMLLDDTPHHRELVLSQRNPVTYGYMWSRRLQQERFLSTTEKNATLLYDHVIEVVDNRNII